MTFHISTPEVTCAYDSEGVRVSESADGQTTYYLNDKQNPTGYAKAIEDRTEPTPTERRT